MKMKYTGRITAFILVLLINAMYIIYYFSKYGFVYIIEFIGLPIVLALAWYFGKQYDQAKFFAEKYKDQRNQLEKSNKKFQAIFEKAAIGIAIIDKNGNVILANPKLQGMLGYTEEELCSMNFGDFSHPDDTVVNLDLTRELSEGKIDQYTLEKRYFHKDGQIVWGKVTSSLFPGGTNESPYILGMVMDITARKLVEQELLEANQKLEDLSNNDGLTGIANRRYFDHYLDKEWRRAARYSKTLSLILLDIDFFKDYNDTYGHLYGDKCLKNVADVLKKTVSRSTDLVARYGGEEFVIVLPETDLSGASVIAEKIRSSVETLQIPHKASKVNNFITVSVGVYTITPDSNFDPQHLIHGADMALYEAKHKGRNRVESIKYISSGPLNN